MASGRSKFNYIEQKIAQGIYIRTWKSGDKVIRIQFCYRRKLCCEPLRLEPTEENIQYAKQLRGVKIFLWVSKQMRHETLQTTLKYYARWVPNSKTFFGYKPVNSWEFFKQDS